MKLQVPIDPSHLIPFLEGKFVPVKSFGGVASRVIAEIDDSEVEISGDSVTTNVKLINPARTGG